MIHILQFSDIRSMFTLKDTWKVLMFIVPTGGMLAIWRLEMRKKMVDWEAAKIGKIPRPKVLLADEVSATVKKN